MGDFLVGGKRTRFEAVDVYGVAFRQAGIIAHVGNIDIDRCDAVRVLCRCRRSGTVTESYRYPSSGVEVIGVDGAPGISVGDVVVALGEVEVDVLIMTFVGFYLERHALEEAELLGAEIGVIDIDVRRYGHAGRIIFLGGVIFAGRGIGQHAGRNRGRSFSVEEFGIGSLQYGDVDFDGLYRLSRTVLALDIDERQRRLVVILSKRAAVYRHLGKDPCVIPIHRKLYRVSVAGEVGKHLRRQLLVAKVVREADIRVDGQSAYRTVAFVDSDYTEDIGEIGRQAYLFDVCRPDGDGDKEGLLVRSLYRHGYIVDAAGKVVVDDGVFIFDSHSECFDRPFNAVVEEDGNVFRNGLPCKSDSVVGTGAGASERFAAVEYIDVGTVDEYAPDLSVPDSLAELIRSDRLVLLGILLTRHKLGYRDFFHRGEVSDARNVVGYVAAYLHDVHVGERSEVELVVDGNRQRRKVFRMPCPDADGDALFNRYTDRNGLPDCDTLSFVRGNRHADIGGRFDDSAQDTAVRVLVEFNLRISDIQLSFSRSAVTPCGRYGNRRGAVQNRRRQRLIDVAAVGVRVYGDVGIDGVIDDLFAYDFILHGVCGVIAVEELVRRNPCRRRNGAATYRIVRNGTPAYVVDVFVVLGFSFPPDSCIKR